MPDTAFSTDQNNLTGPVTTEPVAPSSGIPQPDPSGSPAPFADPPKQDVYATALDPSDPLINRNSQEHTQTDPSIQTGQFVVAGENAAPAPAPAPQNFQPPPTAPQPPPYIPQSQPEPQPVPEQPQVYAPPAPQYEKQPDPTLYAPPPPTPGSQQVASGGGSMIKKLRLVAIIAGALVLLGAIGALVWFFVLGRSSQQPTQSESQVQQTQAVVEEPTPMPKRTEGGFGTLPGLQSTNSAQPATPSAQ
jgi:hypothetical protein